MQLLLVIVQAEDADVLTGRLVGQGLRLTRIDSVGSFLVRGNATLLIGLDEDRMEEALATIRAVCRTRTTFINAMIAMEGTGVPLAAPMPIEAQVGGAIVFFLPVKRFLRLQGGSAPPAAHEHHSIEALAPGARPAAPAPEQGRRTMDLIIAIVHSDHVENVTSALLAAGHRLTRLNTAGGFLRRSNATLIIGAEEDQVDAILALIQANCPLRTEPNPFDAGIPMYGATVFVVEARRFVRM
jgi:uncharacterized protein YaaQ